MKNLKIMLVLLLTTITPKIMADYKLLYETNFSDASWVGHEQICVGDTKEETVNGIYFYCDKTELYYSIANGALTFCENNMKHYNYFCAIPLSGVKDSIIVVLNTYYESNSLRISYQFVEGATFETITPIQTDKKDHNDWKINLGYEMTTSETNAVFLFGRQGSGSKTVLTGIEIYTLAENGEEPDPICDEHTLTVKSNDEQMGTVEMSNTDECNTFNIKATANEGYHFAGWSNGILDDETTISITEDTELTATFEQDEIEETCEPYTLDIQINDAHGGSFTKEQKTENGEEVCNTYILTATANDGFTFDRWSDNVFEPTREITIYENTTITLYFKENEQPCVDYTLKVVNTNEQAGEYVIVQEPNCESNGNVAVIVAMANDGFEFDHWSTGEEEEALQIELTENTTIEIYWKELCVEKQLNAKSQDETMGTVEVVKLDACNTYTIIAQAAEGYHFKEWSNGQTEEEITIRIDENTNITAKFEKDCVPFSFNAVSNDEKMGIVTFTQSEDNCNEYSLIAEAKEGYHFEQWSNGNNEAEISIVIEENTELTAYFAEDEVCEEFILDAYSDDEDFGAIEIVKLEECNTYVLTATANEGYHFVEWSNGDKNTEIEITITEDFELIAYFAEDEQCEEFILDAYSDDEDFGTIEIVKLEECNTYVLTATANEGYHFVEWSNGDKNTEIEITITEDFELIAYFAEDEGCVDPVLTLDNSNYDAGEVRFIERPSCENGGYAHITAIAFNGYTFSHWSDGTTEADYELYLDSDSTLTAYWTSDDTTSTDTTQTEGCTKYSLEVTSQDTTMGDVSVEKLDTCNSYMLTATPLEGYFFIQWSDGNTDNPREIEITENTTLQAQFDKTITFYIEGVSANNAMGQVDGSGYYTYGQEVWITAEPKSGYEFIRWNDYVTQNPRKIIVTNDATYKAYFWLGTGLENVLSEMGISIDGTTLNISGHETEHMSIYTITGQTIFSGLVRSAINLQHGVYIVQIGTQIAKIVL